MTFFFGKKRGTGIPSGATFDITQGGREKLQNFSGDPKSRILFALESEGSSDIREIADKSGVSKGQVERLLPTMIPRYVQVVHSSMNSDEGGI